jgi:hypothetical protein
MRKKYKTASEYALSDISDYIHEQEQEGNPVMTRNGHRAEVWIVTPVRLQTKKTRHLNKLLGITNINYFK